jgi:hypothetical protein
MAQHVWRLGGHGPKAKQQDSNPNQPSPTYIMKNGIRVAEEGTGEKEDSAHYHLLSPREILKEIADPFTFINVTKPSEANNFRRLIRSQAIRNHHTKRRKGVLEENSPQAACGSNTFTWDSFGELPAEMTVENAELLDTC